MTMERIERNLQTGEIKRIPLTPEEIAEREKAAIVTWDVIRSKRDRLIRNSDWTMTADASVDQAQWAAYRQILRDLPQTYAATGPESVVWPVAPSTAGPNSDTVE